ncbi:hypothetical protein V6B14_22495 (plasmid) [Sporosarcina psychrophila]|uniref:hypothetical protein n=1 Tax=Sporosarcina psychrophila TaxID=1476 RepID=UPI0030CBD6B7
MKMIEETQICSTQKLLKMNNGLYELYRGSVWISKQDTQQDNQDTNIAILDPKSGQLKVIAFVNRKGNTWGFTNQKPSTLDDFVSFILKSFEWSEKTCQEMLQG